MSVNAGMTRVGVGLEVGLEVGIWSRTLGWTRSWTESGIGLGVGLGLGTGNRTLDLSWGWTLDSESDWDKELGVGPWTRAGIGGRTRSRN